MAASASSTCYASVALSQRKEESKERKKESREAEVSEEGKEESREKKAASGESKVESTEKKESKEESKSAVSSDLCYVKTPAENKAAIHRVLLLGLQLYPQVENKQDLFDHLTSLLIEEDIQSFLPKILPNILANLASTFAGDKNFSALIRDFLPLRLRSYVEHFITWMLTLNKDVSKYIESGKLPVEVEKSGWFLGIFYALENLQIKKEYVHEWPYKRDEVYKDLARALADRILALQPNEPFALYAGWECHRIGLLFMDGMITVINGGGGITCKYPSAHPMYPGRPLHEVSFSGHVHSRTPVAYSVKNPERLVQYLTSILPGLAIKELFMLPQIYNYYGQYPLPVLSEAMARDRRCYYPIQKFGNCTIHSWNVLMHYLLPNYPAPVDEFKILRNYHPSRDLSFNGFIRKYHLSDYLTPALANPYRALLAYHFPRWMDEKRLDFTSKLENPSQSVYMADYLTLSIKHLDYYHRDLTDDDIPYLIKLLAYLRSVEIINLSNNWLTDKGVRLLVDYFHATPSLLEINFENNPTSMPIKLRRSSPGVDSHRVLAAASASQVDSHRVLAAASASQVEGEADMELDSPRASVTL